MVVRVSKVQRYWPGFSQEDRYERGPDRDAIAPVFDVPETAKLVHESADSGATRTDDFRQHLLRDSFDYRGPAPPLIVLSQLQEHSRQSPLVIVDDLMNKCVFVSDHLSNRVAQDEFRKPRIALQKSIHLIKRDHDNFACKRQIALS